MNSQELEQYNAVRKGVGWYDRSAVGKIAISGEDRFDWLQGMVSNDTKLLKHPAYYGQFRACVLNATGHLLSDMTLVRVASKVSVKLANALNLTGQEFIIADLPRENVRKTIELFDRYVITEDVELRDITQKVGCLSFQGRRSDIIWDYEAGVDDDPIKDSRHEVYTMPADYNGERGFNAYFPIEKHQELREMLKERGVIEVGKKVQEVLRVEAGIPKWGHELDERVIPLEANLRDTHFSLTKGCYVGQEIIARIDSRGHTNRALTGLIVRGDILPYQEEKLFTTPTEGNPESKETGRITSMVEQSPAVGNRPIALGYVRHEHREIGTVLTTESGATLLVTGLPFFAKPTSE